MNVTRTLYLLSKYIKMDDIHGSDQVAVEVLLIFLTFIIPLFFLVNLTKCKKQAIILFSGIWLCTVVCFMNTYIKHAQYIIKQAEQEKTAANVSGKDLKILQEGGQEAIRLLEDLRSSFREGSTEWNKITGNIEKLKTPGGKLTKGDISRYNEYLRNQRVIKTREVNKENLKREELGLQPVRVRQQMPTGASYTRSTGNETKDALRDIFAWNGKMYLGQKAKKLHAAGRLEAEGVNIIPEGDEFVLRVPEGTKTPDQIFLRDKQTGISYEARSGAFSESTPSAEAAPAKELPKPEDKAVDPNDKTTWKRNPKNPNEIINPLTEKYKDLLALRDRAAKARTAAQDVTGQGRIDLSAEDLNLLRENYKNPEIKSAVDDIIKYHKETYRNSDLQAYLDGNRTVFRNPSDGNKVVFDNTWSPEEIADWIKTHPEDAPKGYAPPKNNITEKPQINDTSFSKPVETAPKQPAAKTEVPEPVAEPVAPKSPKPETTKLPGVNPTGPKTPPPEAKPWYEDINSLSPAAQRAVSKSKSVDYDVNGETGRFLRFLVCKAKTPEALVDIRKFVNDKNARPELQANIFNLVRQRADYIKNGQNSVFDDGYWYNVYKKYKLYTQDYNAQGAIAGTNSKNPKKFELLNGESDPFWLDAEQYCKKHGITNEAPTEAVSTQKPLDAYIDAADEGLLYTAENINQVPSEYKYELQERLTKTRDWIEYIETEPEGAVRKTIQELRENGGFEQLPKRVQRVANEKFPEATQAEINNIPDRGKLEESLATQSPLSKAKDVRPDIAEEAKAELQSNLLNHTGNAEPEVRPAAEPESVTEPAAVGPVSPQAKYEAQINELRNIEDPVKVEQELNNILGDIVKGYNNGTDFKSALATDKPLTHLANVADKKGFELVTSSTEPPRFERKFVAQEAPQIEKEPEVHPPIGKAEQAADVPRPQNGAGAGPSDTTTPGSSVKDPQSASGPETTSKSKGYTTAKDLLGRTWANSQEAEAAGIKTHSLLENILTRIKTKIRDAGADVRGRVEAFGKKMLKPKSNQVDSKSTEKLRADTRIPEPAGNATQAATETATHFSIPPTAEIMDKPELPWQEIQRGIKWVGDQIPRMTKSFLEKVPAEAKRLYSSTETQTPIQKYLLWRSLNKLKKLRTTVRNSTLEELAQKEVPQYHLNPELPIGVKESYIGTNGETRIPIAPELAQGIQDGHFRVIGADGRPITYGLDTNKITGSSELYAKGPITLEDLRVTGKPSTASGGSSAGTESAHPTFTFKAPEAPMPGVVASKAKGGSQARGNASSSKPSEFWSFGANLDHLTRGPFGGTGPLSRVIGTPLNLYVGYQGLKNIPNVPGALQEEYKEHYGTERGPVSWGDVITNMGTDPNNLPPIPGAGKMIKHPDGTVENIGINGSSASIKPDGSFTDVHTVNDNTVERSFGSDGKLKNKTTTDPAGNKEVENYNPETGKVTKESIPANNDNSSNWPSFGDWTTKNVVPEYFSNKENFGSYGHSLFGALAGGALGAGIGGLNYILTDENELSEEEKKKRSLARAMLSSAGIGAGIGGLIGGASDYTRA